MTGSLTRLAVAALAIGLAVVAWPSDPSGEIGTVRIAAASEAASCAPSGAADTDVPGWPIADPGDADFLPVVMSSLVTVGPNRFLYNVLDPTYRQIAGPEVPSLIAFYAVERDPVTPVAIVEGAYLSASLDRGLYRAAVDFDCVGEWGAEISVDLLDGSTVSERLRFGVYEDGSTPGIGEPAPRSDSPVAWTEQAAALITTDTNPYPAAYDKTIAETVTSGKPSLVFFATPAFCQTGFCGPTVDLVKMVARDYEGDVEYVNVEPYELQQTVNGLQPVLDDTGHLVPVPAAVDYGIPVEPYLFLVDAEGDVFARFEGFVGADELRAAIEDVLAS